MPNEGFLDTRGKQWLAIGMAALMLIGATSAWLHYRLTRRLPIG